MPYTVSHAIIALPIAKLSQGKISVAAIIIGAVSPDLPYFLALTPTHAPGHSLIGVLLYCLLPSLMIAYAWFNWIETPTLQFWNLPQRKNKGEKLSFLYLTIGILIGAYSHALWDATSHSYGAITSQSEFLQTEILSRPIYKWNQYLSGVVGLAALMLWYLVACIKNSRSNYKGNFRLGVIIYALSITFFVIVGMIFRQSNALADIVVTTSITAVNGVILGACIYALMISFLDNRPSA